MSRRIYIGHLPPTAQKADVEDLMGNFGFVEFESSRDAEDVIRDFNNRPFMGENLVVQEPRDSRRRDVYDARPPRSAGPPRKGVRIAVIGIPSSTSWQDLKDFGRLGGNNIIYADVDRNNPGQGIIEYPTLEDCEDAVKRLAGVDINGAPVTLEIVSTRATEQELITRTLPVRMMPDELIPIVDHLLVITMIDDHTEAKTTVEDLVITNDETMIVETIEEKIEVMKEEMIEETTEEMIDEMIDTLPETDLLEGSMMRLEEIMMTELLEPIVNNLVFTPPS